MNALLLRNLAAIPRSASLQSFKDYKQAEANNPHSATQDGTLLEYETLELRLHPPNVQIDNESYDDVTVITIDSANRPGTLIEVVQCLTELNLSIRRARISSSQSWFVDEFLVSEIPKGKVLHPHKLHTIKKVLSVDAEAAVDRGGSPREAVSVFELAGLDQKGLLAEVLTLLATYGCEVQSSAIWTYSRHVAMVISVIDRGRRMVGGVVPALPPMGPMGSPSGMGMQYNTASPPAQGGYEGIESMKLQKLTEHLYDMLGRGDAIVAHEVVRGEIHHERRLHHLLLLEELKSYEAQQRALEAQQFLQQQQVLQLQGSGSGAAAAAALANGAGSPQLSPQQSRTAAPGTPGGTTGSSIGSNSAGAAGNTFGVTLPAGLSTSISLPAGSAAAGAGGLYDLHSISTSSTAAGQSAQPSAATEPGTPGHPRSPSASGAPPAPPPQALNPALSTSGAVNLTVDGETNGLQHSVDGNIGGQLRPPSHTGTLMAISHNSASGQHYSSASHMVSPAPTAMLASDLLNYTHMDPANMHNLLRAEVRIQHSALLKYHLVTIQCKDRNKLFFDTVCTLADMAYDVYHGTIDSEGAEASQLFYVRPRYGDCVWDPKKAGQLQYMLQCAVLRRFPRGLRVHLQTQDRSSTPAIFQALSTAGFWVTRAELRSLPDGRVLFDFSLTDSEGRIPDPAAVQKACEAAGGIQADELDPLMQVASVGGAAAAAATVRPSTSDTNLGPPGLPPPGFSATRLPSGAGLGPAATAAGGGAGAGAQGQGQHRMHPRVDAARFQFALAGSSADRRKGPLGNAVAGVQSNGSILG